MLPSLFQYGFVVRGLEAGLVIALLAPIVGIFLVLRRYALIADTLAHVSLAGIAMGFLFGINPLISAVVATVLSSTAMEKLRASKSISGESALALFLSGSLALAVVLISVSRGFTTSLFNYLFGSLATVTQNDIVTIVVLAIVVATAIISLSKELLTITFDEEAARVSGVPTTRINMIFMALAAITISLAIPVVGILLISALLVIPVLTALQFRKGFWTTVGIAQVISVIAVIAGMITSFYFNLAPGGTIVLITIALFFFGRLFVRSK